MELASDIRVIDRVNMPHVLQFILLKLSDYDTSLLEWVKLLPLNKKAILHGCCEYPVRTAPRARTFKSGYRLRARDASEKCHEVEEGIPEDDQALQAA